MIFNSVLSKNMNIWNDTNSACERNFKIYYMVDHTWDLWKLLSSYTSTWIHVKSESFLCKEGLTRRETHWATAPMFFVCFPEVLWSDICKDWRFSKRKCWGCITCITNIYYSIHAYASSKASSTEGVRLSRFKSQLWHFTESMATVPDSTWKKNYHSIDFIIKIIIYRTTNKMKVDYSASRLLVWFCYYHMLGLR